MRHPSFPNTSRSLLLPALWLLLLNVALLVPVRADVIYRETFGMAPSATGDAFATVFDWQRFDNNGLAITTTGTSSGVNFNMPGRPVDVANVNAGPNNDGTFGAYSSGILYFGATPSPSLGFTPEFSINPSNYAAGSIVFSFYEGNNTAQHTFRLLVRVGGLWYASTTVFTTPAVALGNFGSQAVLKSIVYDPAPANWQQVNFNGDFILGGTPGTGTTVNSTAGALSLGAAPGAPLNGIITAFGVYGDNGGTGTGNRRIDTFQVDVFLGKNLTWIGSPTADWDTTTTNWITTNLVVTNFANGDIARFDDTGLSSHVNLVTLTSPGATIVSNNSVAYFFEGAGNVSGTGGLTKQGSGSLTVLVANAYSGATTISNGTIQIGDGGSVGNLGSGNITNNGALVINRNNALTMANNLSGSGSITVNGAAPLTITGAGSLTGATVVNSGSLVLNGAWTGGGLLTNAAGTTLSGRGTNSGPVDVSGQLSPGTSAGTFTSGSLTLESGATVVFELGSNTTVGGGVNDLLQVNGNLNLNNNTVTISLFGAPQTGVPYRLVNYTGTRTGTFNPVVVFPGGTRFTAALSYDDGLKQVNVTFGGSSANLVWNDTGGGTWDVGVTSNWLNQASSDVFFQLDNALLDDTSGVTTSINIDVAVAPNVLTNNSSVNAFGISGTGKITGQGRIVKSGSSTLTLTTLNDFSGGVSIDAGAVRFGSLTAAGTGLIAVRSNAVAVAGAAHTNNITLAGGTLGSVSGVASLGGELTNVVGTTSTISMTDPQNNGVNSEMNFTGTLHGGGTLLVIPGTADTTVDSGVGFRLRGTGTSDFSGTIILSNNVKGEIQSSVAGPFSPAGTAKIIATCGIADLNGTATAPASGGFSEFNIRNNFTTNSIFGNDLELIGQGLVTLNPLGSAPTNSINTMGNLKIGAGQELGVIRNATQPQIVFFRSVTLTGGTATFSPKTPGFGAPTATGSDLSLSNITQQAVSSIVMNGLRTLSLTGSNAYTGSTTISNGVLALVGASALSNSPVITVVSPGTLSVTGRGDGKLTLVSGQTLQGNGAITGALDVGVGATITPGLSIGTFTVSGAVVLHGTTRMELDKASATQDLLSTPASVNYGGTLSLTNLSQDTTPLAAGDSFKIFDSAGSTYVGSFSSITPATPGPQLFWDTSSLNVNGTIKVVGPAQPGISSIVVIGSNIVLSGTNGTTSGTYSVLTSTNVTLPLSSWTTQNVSTFLPNGSFSYTNALDPNTPKRFYLIKMP